MRDALQLLREDHARVKGLFKQFEATEDRSERQRIIEETLKELEVHAALEEEIFYPALRSAINGSDMELMDEAAEEHHLADLLMAELRSKTARGGRRDAKFVVLAESVKHHIQEEEMEMLPKAQSLGADRLMQLGERMAERKQELMSGAGGRGARSTNGRRSTPRRGSTGSRRVTSSRSTGGRRTASTRAGGGRAATGSGALSGGTRTRRATSGRGTRRTMAARAPSRKTRGTTRRRATSGTSRSTGRTTRGRSTPRSR